MSKRVLFWLTLAVVVPLAAPLPRSQGADEPTDSVFANRPDFGILPPEQWRRIERSVDRGLAYLATQTSPENGGTETHTSGQPAVTSLIALGFLSRGHKPGSGPYGKLINGMIDYALKKQKEEGLFLTETTDYSPTEAHHGNHTAIYNHAITGIMLSEMYGMTDAAREEKIRVAIPKAITFLRAIQRRTVDPLNQGGFRYYTPSGSDLSVTGWCMMFYRSARNAEFDVPEEYVSDTVRFVRNCYDPEQKGFRYMPRSEAKFLTRGMTGAGLLCLTLGGDRDSQMAAASGRWILDHPFAPYRNIYGQTDRYHYGAYYCCRAMFQLGGNYWREFYPVLSQTLIDNQMEKGQWPLEVADEKMGHVYSTALSVLSLTTPFQLLPIDAR